jgi:TadE-like protein
VLILILAGGIQLGRVFYTYHALEKAVRGGARLLAGATNVNYCDASDASITAAKNLIVFGNLQGEGTPIVQNSTCDGSCLQGLIQVLPEREDTTSSTVNACTCGNQSADDCDISAGGRPPDFIVVNLGDGYPIQFPFAFLTLATPNLKVSVRMPVTGD